MKDIDSNIYATIYLTKFGITIVGLLLLLIYGLGLLDAIFLKIWIFFFVFSTTVSAGYRHSIKDQSTETKMKIVSGVALTFLFPITGLSIKYLFEVSLSNFNLVLIAIPLAGIGYTIGFHTRVRENQTDDE